MHKTLLDTDILSEILKGRNKAVGSRAKQYRAEHSVFTLSVVTVLEVVRGFEKAGARARADTFLASLTAFEIVPVDVRVAELAGRIDGQLLAAGRPIGIADVLIAATAIWHGLELATGNTSHYQEVCKLGFSLSFGNWRE